MMASASPTLQYQHFIPRFILKNFAAPNQPFQKQKKGKKRYAAEVLMNAIDLENKDTTLMPISRTFGFTNMYTDLKAAKQNFLEHELSKLEGGAAEILTRVKEAFVSMRPSVTITQGERNTLRRFLFIMKYRNDSFRSRFFCTLDEYSADDKEELGAYMQKMGLKEPVDVWYHNMRAFLAVEMDVHGDWVHKICSMAYPPDAMWFWAHVQGTFLAFCTTKQVGDEFFLTENVYGIFEGPNSVVMDLTTGNRHCTAYTEFHTFAPLSPQIMMILRSNLLPLPEKTLVGEEAELLEIQKACHINPDSAVSSLEDLPVTKALAFYAKLVNGRVANRQEAGPVPYSRKDTFEFSFFPCSHEHVQKINLVCLHEAKKTIIFRSPLAAKVALQYYLVHSPEKPTAISPAHTLSHLRTLETVLSKLGGRVPTAYRDWMHPVQRELRSYFALGGDKQRIFDDLTQANLLVFKLRTGFDAAIRNLDEKSKALRHSDLADFICREIPVRRIWLYLKILKILTRGEAETMKTMKDLTKFKCFDDGPEDVVVRMRTMFSAKDLPRIMHTASRKQNFINMNKDFGLVRHEDHPVDPNLKTEAGRQQLDQEAGLAEQAGSIKDCGIARIERFAQEYLSQVPDGNDHSFWTEMRLRKTVKENFFTIMKGEKNMLEKEEDIKALQDLLFTLLYPSQLGHYVKS